MVKILSQSVNELLPTTAQKIGWLFNLKYMSEQDKILDAFSNGEMSAEERDKLLNELNDGKYVITKNSNENPKLQQIIVTGKLWFVEGKVMYVYPITTFKDLWGKNTFKKLPSYNRFVIEPSHINYKSVIKTKYGYNYNLYRPLSYKPKIGEWDNIKKVLKHLAKDNELNYQTIVEWLYMLYKYPKVKVTSLAFVGKRKSAKGTFMIIVNGLVESGYKSLPPSILSSQFNEAFMGLTVACFDEKLEGKKGKADLQTMKTNISSPTLYINPKGTPGFTVVNHMRYLILSNDEESPFQLEDENERFLIYDVDRVKDSDNRIIDKIKSEISGFAYYLLNEYDIEYEDRMIGNGKERFWFPPTVLKTEAAKRIQLNSRDSLTNDVESLITEIFENNEDMCSLLINATNIGQLLHINNSSKRINKLLTMVKCVRKNSCKPISNRSRYTIKKNTFNILETRVMKRESGGWLFERIDFDQQATKDAQNT